jgi:putative oxidoreductase
MIVAFLMVHTQDLLAITGTGAWAHEGIALFLLGGLGLIFTGAGKYALSYKHALD